MTEAREPTQQTLRWQQWVAAMLTLLVCLSVVAPSLGSRPEDSYPLSTYPMFATARGTPLVHQLVGVNADGQRFPVPPELLGTSEVLQAKALIKQAVEGGRKARRRLCEQVLARLRDAAESARSSDSADWVTVELIAARYDAIAYLTESPRPISTRRLQRCRLATPRAAEARPRSDPRSGGHER